MRYQALVLDIDGTLGMDVKTPVHPQIKNAIREIRDMGIHVILASGRDIYGSVDIALDLDLYDTPHVCDGGSRLFHVYRKTRGYDFQPHRPNRPIRPAAVLAIRESLDYHGPQPLVSTTDGEVWRMSVEMIREDQIRGVVQAVRRADPIVNIRPFTHVRHVGLWGVEILESGVDKAWGVELALRELGVPWVDVAVVGDNFTDLPLFYRAAFGFAVANAHKDVRSRADSVVPEARHNGVVAAIERVRTEGEW